MPTPQKNHYQTLQISRQATPSEIKQAFRRLARQHHPDLNPNNPQSAEIFRNLRTAYDTLSDPIQRRYYDEAQGFVSPRTDPTQSTNEAVPFDSPHHFYLQGIDHEANRNYRAALEAYDQALERQPEFSQALLHRAKVRYALAQDRAVLEDCTRLIKLQAHQASAYFYQGLARTRLGYTQSALQAFNQALNQEPDHGRAYYQRAIAHLELGDQTEAIADFQQALECFQAQGDGQYYRRTTDKLHGLGIRFTPATSTQKSSQQNSQQNSQRSSQKTAQKGSQQQASATSHSPTPTRLAKPTWLIPATLGQLPSILFNPSANLLPLYGKLGPIRASLVGVIWLGFSYGLGILAAILRWSADSQQVVWPIAIVVTLAIASFVAGIGLFRMVRGYWEGISQVLFVAGAALLPMGLLCLVMAPRAAMLWPWQWSLMAIALSMSILILHSGLIQICNLPEALATFAVPTLLLTSSWLAYWTFQTLVPPPLDLLDAPNLISNPVWR